MDDEAKQLLREIRDIGLRDEARVELAISRQRQAMIAGGIALAIALGGLAYALWIASVNRANDAEQRQESVAH